MKVRYLSHTSFLLESEESTVIFDPWFLDSTEDAPKIQGLLPRTQAIDFHVAKFKGNFKEFSPDAVLLSSLLPIYAPITEIGTLLSHLKKVRPVLGMPRVDNVQRVLILNNLAEHAVRAEVVSLDGVETKVTIGPWEISICEHPIADRAIYYITCPTGSFLHIAESPINRNPQRREVDSLFERFKNRPVDFLAITGSGVCERKVDSRGANYISEHASMSAPEAARLVQFLNPKMVGFMSVASSMFRSEGNSFVTPDGFNEDFFMWCVGLLSPETLLAMLTPGFVVNLTDLPKSQERPVSSERQINAR